jgi:ferredoxin-NADP reductase
VAALPASSATGVPPADLGLLGLLRDTRPAFGGSPLPRRRDTPRPAPPSQGAPPGTVLDRVDVTADILVLRIARPPELRFVAGQHVKVGVGDASHPYSIASAPHEPWLELCVELVPEGRLTPRLFALRPGDRVRVDAVAKGSLVLAAAADHHFMCATVTGIAPFVSMLRHALAERRAGQRFYVLHGASYADEHPYAGELVEYSRQHPGVVSYVSAISRPGETRNAGWSGEVGRLPAIADRHAESFGLESGRPHVYACGHAAMVEAITARFESARVPVSTETFFK